MLLPVALAVAGCRAGTAGQELEQLRARASTLEAENAHLQGQVSLTETERDQLRDQVNSLTAELAHTSATGPAADVVAGDNLVILPRTVKPGEWIAVYVKNYPPRLLPQAGVALRGAGETNLTHIEQLASANLFLLPIPKAVTDGTYRVVLGEAGALGPGAKLDDQVEITIRAR
jgi:hypothetical protein